MDLKVVEPLSSGFITMSCRCLSWLIACRSEVVRLSRIGLGLQVVMSSLTASKNVSRTCSLLVGGFQVLLLWKGLFRLFTLVVLFSSKKYSVSCMRQAKSYMSAEISGQLMCLGVGTLTLTNNHNTKSKPTTVAEHFLAKKYFLTETGFVRPGKLF